LLLPGQSPTEFDQIPLSPPDLAGVLVDVKDMSFVIAVCLTHRVLARSLGWLRLISGLSALVPGVVGIADPGSYLPVPFLPGLIWTLIVSILLTVRPRRPPTDAVDQMDTAKPARCGAPLRALVQNWLQLFTAFLLALAIMILLNNVGEEIGWRGFVFSRLQDRQGPLRGVC
jgi:membrane protease YdiL (CAAX protease family)